MFKTADTSGDAAFDKQPFPLMIVLIALLGMIIRLCLLGKTIDFSADAYHRAYIAYCWAMHPHLIAGEIWTPALTYAGGVLNLSGADPFLSLRIVSLICGTLTLLLLPHLFVRMFGIASAILSAFLLAIFPLHAALSVCSLAEAPYVFFFFLGYFLLLKSTDAFIANESQRWSYLGATIFAFALSSATRVECWVFIPLWLIYFYINTRKAAPTALLFFGLAAFPIYWISACAINFHSPFLSFLGPSVNLLYQPQTHFGYANAIGLWSKTTILFLGPLLVLCVLFGFARAVWLAASNRGGRFGSLSLHLLVTALTCILTIHAFETFGNFIENRFALAGSLLLFPFAGAPLEIMYRLLHARKRLYLVRTILISLILSCSMMLSFQFFKPNVHLNAQPNKAVDDLAGWLNSPAVRACPILMTTLRWNFLAYRVALLCRHKFKQITMIDSYYGCLPVLQARVRKYPPELFVATNFDNELEIPYAKCAITFDFNPVPLRSFSSGNDEKSNQHKQEYIHVYKIVAGSVGLVTPIRKTFSNWRTDMRISDDSAAFNYCDYQW